MRLAKRGSALSCGMPIASKKRAHCSSVPIQKHTYPSAVRAGLRSNKREAPMPPMAGMNVSPHICSDNTNSAIVSNIGSSTDCPAPVRSRYNNAASTVCTKTMPQRRSDRFSGTYDGTPPRRSCKAGIAARPWIMSS